MTTASGHNLAVDEVAITLHLEDDDQTEGLGTDVIDIGAEKDSANMDFIAVYRLWARDLKAPKPITIDVSGTSDGRFTFGAEDDARLTADSPASYHGSLRTACSTRPWVESSYLPEARTWVPIDEAPSADLWHRHRRRYPRLGSVAQNGH